jgi:EAL domain-containing protein (putative c-di-GMP-specific phosphodiesterase class I)
MVDGGAAVDEGPAASIDKEISSAKVLVIDDEPGAAQSYARILIGRGHRVTIAHGGHEGAALASQGFDVVISDVAMPDMNGLELLRTIRLSDLDVPMVFVSGSATVDSAVQAIEYGAFRYLLKPVAAGDLLDVVVRATRIHRLARVRREAAMSSELAGKPIGDRAGLEARFSSAIDKLWIAAQPIVSWKNRALYGYETLLRTDEATLRNPMDFLDAADRLGRAPLLGRIIRDHIARSMSGTTATVFVNLHPSALQDEELFAAQGALTPFASRVVLEITERASLDGVHDLPRQVARLRALGYRIAIDDLGAGYAGLTSFAQLEPEVAKIDMSLVRGIDCSTVKQKLVHSIMSLCVDLDVRLIAEGIETAEERNTLISLGGDLFQGYLFGRPDRGFPVPRY